VVVIERLAVMGVQRCGGSAHQNGARNELLQLSGPREDIIQRRTHKQKLSDQIIVRQVEDEVRTMRAT
jgi:hypothetical protein